MSNVLLSRITRITKSRSALTKFQNSQIRHKSGKKFLIPDSFQPHLRGNNSRRNVKKPEGPGSRFRALGQPSKNELETHEGKDVLQALDDKLEYQVARKSEDAFALSTERVIHDYCGQTHHPHIATSMKAYLSVDRTNEIAVQLFWDAVADYLPPDPLTRNPIKSPGGKLKHSSYSWSSFTGKQSEDDLGYSRNVMNLGWHIFLFSTPIRRNHLLYDGTDERFLPGPSSVWRYRLWAGGSINLYKTFGVGLSSRYTKHQLERPIDLRIVGADQTPEKLFVTISKRFYEFEGQLRPQEYFAPEILERLSADPVHSNKGQYVVGPVLEEKYTLCFLRNSPELSPKGVATRVITPPVQPKFSHTFTPDRHLLFCWSALSYNAHLIHLDEKFAQEEYGAKDLVVHGPLTLVLVLEWFHREITRYALQRQLSRFHLYSIDYRCLAPLFVDEPITLCTKPSKFPTPGTLADSWEVWVQKDSGDGQQSMPFKGTIKLRTEPEPRYRHGHKTNTRVDFPGDASVRVSGNAVNDFKSPLF